MPEVPQVELGGVARLWRGHLAEVWARLRPTLPGAPCYPQWTSRSDRRTPQHCDPP